MQILSKPFGLSPNNRPNKNLCSFSTSGEALIYTLVVTVNMLTNVWQNICHDQSIRTATAYAYHTKKYFTICTISIVLLRYPLYIEFCSTDSKQHSVIRARPLMKPISSSTLSSHKLIWWAKLSSALHQET